jgi:urea transport system permease protein
MLKLLNGPQTLGRGPVFWISAAVVLAAALIYPIFADPYDVGNFGYFFIWIFMTLGLCMMWGLCGMLSFGQTFFFGLAGYGYGVLAIDLGNTPWATMAGLFGAVTVSALAALVLGYFMIYGRISGVFFGIVTLSVTLALAFFLGQTAGPEWHVGEARLNGFNGMQGMSPLNIPFFGAPIDLEQTVLYYVLVVGLIIIYLLLRILANSRFGNVLVAIREDPQRAELLGYDVRRYQLTVFVLGSALAGLSGVLYTSWGQFITPSSIGLPAASMPIIWVAFSGRSDLTATLVGTFVLLFGFQTLTIYSQESALILMGGLLVATVLFVPKGFIVGLGELLGRLLSQRRTVARSAPAQEA